MRQLFPEPADIDPVGAHAAAERQAVDGRPWTLLNMVASVDGATAIDGTSGQLGGTADKDAFRAIRAIADVILVAGGTAHAEEYGPPRTSEARQAERIARGQTPFPRIALLSGSLDLDPSSSLFTEAPEPPLIFTGSQPPEQRRVALEGVAEVHRSETERPIVADVLDVLGASGVRVVLCEGGPSLNGQLIEAGLVDEINVTISPLLAGGGSKRVAVGPDGAPTGLTLSHLWLEDSVLLGRYVRASGGRPPSA